MRIRWKGFELPTQVLLDEATRSSNYGKFVVEPFERGYGITIGNSLRRVLLSSLEGVAPVSLRVKGAMHEFASISGIYEDVVNIALNVKEIKIAFEGSGPETLRIDKSGKGKVYAKDLTGSCPSLKIANPELVICEIVSEKASFYAEIVFHKGRGFVRSEDLAWAVTEEVGIIPLDASYSPVLRTRWRVEETRVGKMTNYDKLILEIWTNGTITPDDAMVEAAIILRKHLNPFIKLGDLGEELTREAPSEDNNMSEVASAASARTGGDDGLDRDILEKLEQPVTVLDPSVRAANCLSAEGIKTIRDLVKHTEHDMLQVRNFGKTSMKEIKIKLAERGLSFGMDLK